MENAHDIFRSHRVRKNAVARALGLTPAAITQWKTIPVEHVVAVSQATGIPREKLRPDLYAGMVYVGDGSQ
jgi:DNA-binding transcriptional regulator YdaS (Cro superfamily)